MNKRGAGANAPQLSAVEAKKRKQTKALKTGDLIKTEKGIEKYVAPKKNTRGAGAKANKKK